MALKSMTFNKITTGLSRQREKMMMEALDTPKSSFWVEEEGAAKPIKKE